MSNGSISAINQSDLANEFSYVFNCLALKHFNQSDNDFYHPTLTEVNPCCQGQFSRWLWWLEAWEAVLTLTKPDLMLRSALTLLIVLMPLLNRSHVI